MKNVIDYRIEAEYFLSKFITNDEILDSIETVDAAELISLSSGKAFRSKEFNTDKDIKIAKIGDVTNQRSPAKWDFVSEQELNYQKANYLNKNDIIQTLTGDPPDVGKVHMVGESNYPMTWNQRVAKIVLKNSGIYNQASLFAVLSSEVCRLQLERYAKGIRQRNLGAESVKWMKIPKLPKSLQELISKAVNKSNKLLEKSLSCDLRAEKRLLEIIGVSKFKPPTKKSSTLSFKESFIATGRLDAEHYQPKFEQLKSIISQHFEIESLSTLLSVNMRGTQPKYSSNGLVVINSKHVKRGEVDLSDNRFAIQKSKEHLTIQKGDVLLNGTGVGTIGRASPYNHDQKALPDNHVTILRTNKINPVYLSVFLNSFVGQYQVEKYLKGSSGQVELYPKDIGHFYIPMIDEEQQEEIAKLANQTFDYREISQSLMNSSKKAVDIFILKGEEAANSYLRGKL